jgi:hypothetical protein
LPAGGVQVTRPLLGLSAEASLHRARGAAVAFIVRGRFPVAGSAFRAADHRRSG